LSKILAVILITAILVAAMLLGIAPMTRASPPPAPAFWVVPDTKAFSTNNASVGTLFNVTVWVSTVVDSFSWQVKLAFNASQLQVPSVSVVKYSGGSQSQWFVSAGANGSIPVVPVIDNVAGTVLFGEVLSTPTDFIPPSSNSLFYVTFNITAAPPMGGNLTSSINTGIYAPGDTYVLDVNTITEPGFQYGNCTYSFMSVSPPPTILTPTQVPPSNNVPGGQNVTVSANVTDNSGTGLQNVTLSYSIDNSTFTNVTMTLNATTSLWDGTIPGYPAGTTVYYMIIAYDNLGNSAVNSNTGNWSYPVVPEFGSSALIILMLVAMAGAVLLMRKKIIR
jgi:hypothetical protein